VLNAALLDRQPRIIQPIAGATIDIDYRTRRIYGVGSFGAVHASASMPLNSDGLLAAGDIINMIGPALTGVQTPPYWVLVHATADGTTGATSRAISIHGGNTNNEILLARNGGNARLEIWDGGVGQAAINAGAWAANETKKIAVRVGGTNDVSVVYDGSATQDTSCTIPAITGFLLGNAPGGGRAWGARVYRLTLGVGSISDATLQTLTV
jgi:hypothetical protein